MVRPLKTRDERYLVLPLNAVLGAPSHIAVLRALRHAVHGLTGREIAREARVARQATLNALSRLESTGIVRRRRAGRACVFSLNDRHWLVRRGLLPLLEAESDFRRQIERFLRKAVEARVVSGIIFGSTARGEESSRSDLDLCLIVEKEGDKEGVRDALFPVQDRLTGEFGVQCSPLLFSRREFVRGYRKKEAFFENVLQEGRTFTGLPLKEVAIDAKDRSDSRGNVQGGKLRAGRRRVLPRRPAGRPA